ncbi:MAG: hypothetical protein ACLP5H_34050 [Desulfomonilaceae bacterium]
MGSLRSIAGESQAEKNRVRSLSKKAAALSGLGEQDALTKVNRFIRESRDRLAHLKVVPVSEEEALTIFCGLFEHDLERRKGLSELLGVSEDTFLAWNWDEFMKLLERIQRHGCVECRWRKTEICSQTGGPDPIPENCPGYEQRSHPEE